MPTLHETPAANRLHITIYGKRNAGKSSLINCLQSEVIMETGEISAKIERGRHTTRHSELIFLEENTYILDTPGFSSLGLFDLEKEELAGYMAGVAAVKLGYTHLGYLGGMAVPAVQRFGYGFVQGVDAAAGELGVDATVEYVYGNQFFGDPDITAYADNWYQNLGVQAVFACGGGIFTSAGEAAAKVPGAKVIGVDVDQSFTLDAAYGEGVTLTSAMKGLAATVNHMLDEVAAGNFANYGGKAEALGLVSGDDPSANYVLLPMDTTLWGDGFSQDDYKALVKDMFDGKITVSDDISAMPAVSNITVNDLGNIK